MTHKNQFISFLTLATAFICMWLTGYYRAQSNVLIQPNQLPDAFMENVRTTVLNKDGNPSMKIASPKMTHYAQNDTTNLINPSLTLYHKGPQPWLITSKFATATEGVDNIQFSQDVNIQHPGDNENPLTLIKTATLLVHTVTQTADTSDLITLIQPSISVKAIGMHADLNAGDVKLLSQARGEYAPNV